MMQQKAYSENISQFKKTKYINLLIQYVNVKLNLKA